MNLHHKTVFVLDMVVYEVSNLILWHIHVLNDTMVIPQNHTMSNCVSAVAVATATTAQSSRVIAAAAKCDHHHIQHEHYCTMNLLTMMTTLEQWNKQRSI